MTPFIGDHVVVRPIYGHEIVTTGVVTTTSGPIVVVRRDDNPMSEGELFMVNTNTYRLSVT